MASPWDISTNLNTGNLANNFQNPTATLSNDVSDIGGDYSNYLKGIGGQLFGQAPGSFKAPGMDPGSANQVADIQNSLLKTPDQQAQGLLAGSGAAGAIANQSGNQNAESKQEGGGGMPGMSAAIGAKAAKNFATSQGRLTQNAQFAGAQMANQNLNTASANAIAMQNAQNNINSSLNNLTLQSNQARYNTIAGIMSGAGSIAGVFAAQPNAPNLNGTTGNAYSNSQNMYNEGVGPSQPTTQSNPMGSYGMTEGLNEFNQ